MLCMYHSFKCSNGVSDISLHCLERNSGRAEMHALRSKCISSCVVDGLDSHRRLSLSAEQIWSASHRAAGKTHSFRFETCSWRKYVRVEAFNGWLANRSQSMRYNSSIFERKICLILIRCTWQNEWKRICTVLCAQLPSAPPAASSNSLSCALAQSWQGWGFLLMVCSTCSPRNVHQVSIC